MALKHCASFSMTEAEQEVLRGTARLEEGSIEYLDEPFVTQIGNYVLERPLGDGSGGRVYLAIDNRTGERVAIKMVPKTAPRADDDDDEEDETGDMGGEGKSRIRQEDMARQENAIHRRMANGHKHVIKHIATYENKEYVCLAMQYAGGGDLFELVRKKGRLEEHEAWRIFRQLISAVSFVHGKGICHRDIKPENIFLDDQDNVLLGDFGHARTWSALSMTKESCGSLCYSAPEVLVASRSYVGPEIDLWSCGTVLYVMLTGQKPFWSRDNYEVYRKIKKGQFRRLPSFLTPQSADLIKRLLVVDPLKRAKVLDVLMHEWVRKRPPSSSNPSASSPTSPSPTTVTVPIPITSPSTAAAFRHFPPLSPQRRREPHPLLMLRKCGGASPASASISSLSVSSLVSVTTSMSMSMSSTSGDDDTDSSSDASSTSTEITVKSTTATMTSVTVAGDRMRYSKMPIDAEVKRLLDNIGTPYAQGEVGAT